jgi:hypothetical protein
VLREAIELDKLETDPHKDHALLRTAHEAYNAMPDHWQAISDEEMAELVLKAYGRILPAGNGRDSHGASPRFVNRPRPRSRRN